MTRKEAKEFLPIIKAFADGKTIQISYKNEWITLSEFNFDKNPKIYRIKPEPKYRPFKTKGECWNEMLKHQPFGWVKSKKSGSHFSIGSVLWDKEFDDVFVTFACDGMLFRCSKTMIKDFTFADGTPFGINEEQQ